MATAGGPKKITDGLVVSFDAANDKSFRGEPTVNLLGAAGSDAEIERSGNTYPYYSVNINSLVQSNWSEGNNVITISFEGKRDFSVGGTGGGGDGYPVFYVYFTDWSWATTLGITSYDWSYNERTVTIPNPSGKTVFFSIYHMNSGNPGKSYSRKHQIEFKSYSTPFVNGTRGTTVATGGGWIDRSGSNNHGELVNNVTFNSSNLGSLVFDGTNQRINLTSFSVSFLTLSTWVFRTSPANNQGICRKQNGWAVSIFNGFLQLAPGTSWQFYNTGYIIPLNTWVNITYRYIGSGSNSQSVFINGVLIWTNPNGLGSLPTNSNQVRIGFDDNNWWWVGRISQTQIYNRILSDEEILQNFNATKNRYGL